MRRPYEAAEVPMRIIQISDTHISRRHHPFAANVQAVRQWLKRTPCDLVVNTGDLSMNGAVDRDDLLDAAAWHSGLGIPVLAVPGNHDVGDVPELRSDQVLDDTRLAGYADIVGEGRWTHDVGGWRLVGINAMLLGTGHPEEERQFAWLRDALRGPAPTALFLHKPLFIDDPSEGPRGYWTVRPEPRRRLLDILGQADLRLIASGHLHVARTQVFDGVPHVWGPSSAFVCGPSQEADIPGERRIGAVVHDFDDAGVTSRTVFLDEDGAENLTIDPHLAEIYPAPAADALAPA